MERGQPLGEQPFRVLAVPSLVRTLALAPLLLMFTPAFPPMCADGRVTLTPFEVILNFGLRMVTSLFFCLLAAIISSYLATEKSPPHLDGGWALRSFSTCLLSVLAASAYVCGCDKLRGVLVCLPGISIAEDCAKVNDF